MDRYDVIYAGHWAVMAGSMLTLFVSQWFFVLVLLGLGLFAGGLAAAGIHKLVRCFRK